MPTFQEFFYYAFIAIIGICAPMIVTLLAFLVKSVFELNTKLSIVLERLGVHEREIQDLKRQNAFN